MARENPTSPRILTALDCGKEILDMHVLQPKVNKIENEIR